MLIAPISDQKLWIHPLARPLPCGKLPGPFVHAAGGDLLTPGPQHNTLDRSTDQGESWTSMPLWKPGPNAKEFKPAGSRMLFRTSDGTLIFSFFNYNEALWLWRDELKDILPGTRGPHYVMRSTDEGKTWSAPTMLHSEWTGEIRNIIQLDSGRILISSMKMLSSPGRHTVLTYHSDDDGLTWKPSNPIDLGGHGHHGGVTEATIEQMKSGSVLMLLRTNWRQFWRAISHDGGASWRDIQPSGIDASSSPGLLKRLESGRLLLIWNRLHPTDTTDCEMRGGDCIWSEVRSSNHREELSIAWYDEQAHRTSDPVVIARQKGAHLAYPRLFEKSPGELWLTIMTVGPKNEQLSLAFSEKDFL